MSVRPSCSNRANARGGKRFFDSNQEKSEGMREEREEERKGRTKTAGTERVTRHWLRVGRKTFGQESTPSRIFRAAGQFPRLYESRAPGRSRIATDPLFTIC